MDPGVESRLQVAIIGTESGESSIGIDLQVRNSQRFPVHVLDIEVVIEEPSDRKARTAKMDHSCIVQPRSSKVVKVPLASLMTSQPPAASVPYMVRANVAIKDRVHGAYQVSTERVRKLFSPGNKVAEKKPSGAATAPVKKVEKKNPRLEGKIDSMHVRTNFPKEVAVAFDFQVKNTNFLPLKFLHADFNVKSGETKILETRVGSNATIPGRSSGTIKMKLSIPIQTIRNSFPDGMPSSVLPVQMDIAFWFKEMFYGEYKIEARKVGVLVVPEEPLIKIKRMVFSVDDKKPIVKMELEVSNPNEFELELKSLKYQASSRTTGSVLMLATFEEDDPVSIKSGGMVSVSAVTNPAGTHEFGSVLWKLFKGDKDYVVKTSVEVGTANYGKISFHS